MWTLFVEKSTDYIFKMAYYAGQKKRNLVKLMSIVFPNGNAFEIVSLSFDNAKKKKKKKKKTPERFFWKWVSWWFYRRYRLLQSYVGSAKIVWIWTKHAIIHDAWTVPTQHCQRRIHLYEDTQGSRESYTWLASNSPTVASPSGRMTAGGRHCWGVLARLNSD